MGETKDLASWVASTGAAEIPAEVRHQAKRCLLDWLGVTLAGAAEPSARVLLEVASQIGETPQATILGCGRKASLLFAALINGFNSHVLDYDDTYNPGQTTVHGSAPVWPVVLALAERAPVPGSRGLAAFVLGWETEVRVALAAGPSHYDAGWHVTGTVGHIGAAAASASVLRLDADRVTSAFGTAGTQAAGLKQVYGSMGKALHPGKAAMDGLLSALLAQAGFSSTDAILEGKRGFLNVYSSGPEPARLTDGLGMQWLLLEDGFKAYACGSLTHPTIDAVISLRNEHSLLPDQVESIDARVHSYVSWVTAKQDPTSGLEGKFSIYHSAAVALVDGAARLNQFTDERTRSLEVAAMRDKVSITVDDGLAKDAAEVTIRLRDGRVLKSSVAHNKGTPGNPMSDREIEEKFVDLAAPALGVEVARSLAVDVWRIEELEDMGDLARRCAGMRQEAALG